MRKWLLWEIRVVLTGNESHQGFDNEFSWSVMLDPEFTSIVTWPSWRPWLDGGKMWFSPFSPSKWRLLHPVLRLAPNWFCETIEAWSDAIAWVKQKVDFWSLIEGRCNWFSEGVKLKDELFFRCTEAQKNTLLRRCLAIAAAGASMNRYHRAATKVVSTMLRMNSQNYERIRQE